MDEEDEVEDDEGGRWQRGVAVDAVQQVPHVGVDRNELLVLQVFVVDNLVDVHLTISFLRLDHPLAEKILSLQEDAAANAVRLNLVVERVVLRAEALPVGLEEEASGAVIALDEVALRQVVASLSLLFREAEVDERLRVYADVFGHDVAAQWACVLDARAVRLDHPHHAQHAREVALRRALDVAADVVSSQTPRREHQVAIQRLVDGD